MRESKKTKLRARAAELVKESWMRKMLQDAGSAITIDAVSSEIVTLSSFDELKGSPGYYEALSQARLLPEAWQDKLNEEQGKAMERALSALNKRAVYVNGDGSCALYAILRGVGITVAPDDSRKVFAGYEVVRDTIRQELAEAASQFYSSIATRLGNSSEWLEVEDITFIAMALGVQLNMLCGARPKDRNYDFRCYEDKIVNPSGRKAAITLLVYRGHYSPILSTVDPPRGPTIVIAKEADVAAFLEMGFWKFWKLWTEFTYEEPQFAGKSFTFRSWRKEFEPAVSLSPQLLEKVCVRALDFGSLSRLQLVGSSAGKQDTDLLDSGLDAVAGCSVEVSQGKEDLLSEGSSRTVAAGEGSRPGRPGAVAANAGVAAVGLQDLLNDDLTGPGTRSDGMPASPNSFGEVADLAASSGSDDMRPGVTPVNTRALSSSGIDGGALRLSDVSNTEGNVPGRSRFPSARGAADDDWWNSHDGNGTTPIVAAGHSTRLSVGTGEDCKPGTDLQLGKNTKPQLAASTAEKISVYSFC